MTKRNDGILGGLLSAASQAGRLWRDRVLPAVNTARTHLNELESRANTARDYLRAHTPEGREVRSQWEALQKLISQGVSAAITGVQGVAAVSAEALNGMDPRLALALFEVHRLERAAEAKSALEMPELVGAKAKFEALKAHLEADPQADVHTEIADLQAALDSAKEAIKGVSSSPAEVRRQFILAGALDGELGTLLAEYEAASPDYLERFGQAALGEPVDATTLTSFTTRLAALEQQVKSDNPMTAAVTLRILHNEMLKVQARLVADTGRIGKEMQDLRNLEGLMNAQLTEAEKRDGQDDEELLAAMRAFLKATRNRPIDLAAAEAQKDAYIARLERLQGLD